jgi:hypothetical protein
VVAAGLHAERAWDADVAAAPGLVESYNFYIKIIFI